MILKQLTIIKQHLITHIYYNFYHDTFNFRNNGIKSSSQQTDTTNTIIDTNPQTNKYIDDNYLKNHIIATVLLSPTPSLNDNYLWIPGISDNVVPGLDSMITCTQSKHATLTALQHAITTINDNIQTEIKRNRNS